MSLNVCLCMFVSLSVCLQMWHVGLSCDGWRMPFQSTCQFVAHGVCSPVFPLFFSLFFPSCFPSSPPFHPLLFCPFRFSSGTFTCRRFNLSALPEFGKFTLSSGCGCLCRSRCREAYLSQVTVEGRRVSAFFPKNLKNSLKFDDP